MPLVTALATPLVAALLALPPAPISVSAPARVHVDAWIAVDGSVRVQPGHRRVVRIEERVRDRWHVMDRTRSARSGAFELGLRSGPIPQIRTFRVVAPRTPGLRRAGTGPFDVRMYVDLPGVAWQHPGA